MVFSKCQDTEPGSGTHRRNGSQLNGNDTYPSNDTQQANVGVSRVTAKLNCLNHRKIGTWNVRTLLEAGKLKQVTDEAERLQIDVLGLAEHRWAGKGHFTPESGGVMAYSGNGKSGWNGVTVYIRKEWNSTLLGYNSISDRQTNKHHYHSNLCSNKPVR